MLHRTLSRALATLSLVAPFVLLPACTTVPDDADATASTDQAYTGPIPTLDGTSPPPGAPRSWEQPPSEGAFGKNGYCGATAAANALAWYGRNVSPRQAIDDGCWSFIGTTPSDLAAYLQDKHADLGCSARTLERDGDALAYVEWMIQHGHPVILQFMVGKLNAHWVTVVGVRGHGSEKQLIVMSDGGYYRAKWDVLHDAWESGWGGPFPHVVCTTPVRGPLAERLTVE